MTDESMNRWWVSDSQAHLEGLSADRPAGVQDLVSVLVPCCGQLEYTQLCVQSLLRHTSTPFELVFLDIAALDGTAEYLAGVRDAARVAIQLVRANTDMEIPAASREALKLSRGEYLVLVNNDVLVTPDWLTYLAGLAALAPQIGLVGPMSNYATPPQLVERVPYRLGMPRPRDAKGTLTVSHSSFDFTALDHFAENWREQHRGKWMEVDRLGGFCLLIKRQVLPSIDPFIAQSSLGLFDTDKLCLQVRQAGYMLACCRDLFIHNFGSRTSA
jgi:GT2 family glycosyltransferase